MNAYASRARLLKSQAIAEALWFHADDEQRRDPNLPVQISRLAQGARDAVAQDAGQRPPSEETWGRIVEEMCKRVQAERRGEPMPCSDCVYGEQAAFCERHTTPCPCATEVYPCPTCEGTGHAPCRSCLEPDRPGTIVTPGGLYCGPCAHDDYPMLERYARMLEDPFAGLAEDDEPAAEPEPA